MQIREFIDTHYRHFNAAALKDATIGYEKHLQAGGQMLVALGGAMSTAELGMSLAEMIRQNKVHAISCTGANLEEDIFNLVAHKHYKRLPNYRDLTAQDELDLLESGLKRVTDTCIPEGEAVRRIQGAVMDHWMAADKAGESFFPHQFFYKVLLSGALEKYYEIDPKNSWMLAAAQKNLPIFCPGWEDSSIGNIFVARCHDKTIKNIHTVKSGAEYFNELLGWYPSAVKKGSIGFYQIGGGIAGDFPICVVPTLIQDLDQPNTPLWGYFCQISDSITSFGSYSGALPNEKITWAKLGVDTPKFVIESDATIVAPLMFGYLLGW
jgi:deoxyhypusine synthase